MTSICFHCNEDIHSSLNITSALNNQIVHFCCKGCQAVAESIRDDGLENFYTFRVNSPSKISEIKPEEAEAYESFDQKDIEDKLITRSGEEKHIELCIEGITCAACSWLIEKKLLKHQGVIQVSVNPITQRASVTYNRLIKLSEMILELRQLGFDAYPFNQSHQEKLIQKNYRSLLIRVGVSGLGMMQAMMFSIGTYLGDASDMDASHRLFLQWMTALVTTPIVIYAAFPFFKKAWNRARANQVSMETSISIAILLAYLASIFSLITTSGHVYFDSLSMFIFFILLGHWFEQRVFLKSIIRSQSKKQFIPLAATKVKLADISEKENRVSISVEKLQPDDIIIVKSGALFPIDGTILQGGTYVDESLLTGESLPIKKHVNDSVLAGALNIDQAVYVKVTHTSEHTYLSAFERMKSTQHKSTSTEWLNGISQWFILTVLCLTLCVFIWWYPIAPEQALWIAISVLVISCPCAISLASPIALTIAMTQLSEKGILLIKPQAFFELSKIDLCIFDKTGTLTEGKMSVHRCEIEGDYPQSVIEQIACALERDSTHPIARSFHAIDDQSIHVTHKKEVFNAGICASWKGDRYFIGNRSNIDAKDLKHLQSNTHDEPLWFMAKSGEEDDKCVSPLSESNQHLKSVCLYKNNQLIATFSLQDPIRKGSKELIEHLTRNRISTVILSGDSPEHVQNTAKTLGIKEYYFSQTPEQKKEKILDYRNKGKRVLMIGDGLNDVFCLNEANVGFTLGSSADLTQYNADGIFVNNNLHQLYYSILLAKKTYRIIRQNIFWAIIYNLTAIPLAALGLIPPWLAAIGMSASSVLVLINALRLKNVFNENTNSHEQAALLQHQVE